MNLIEGLKISEYKKVRINLDSAYKWGRGWTQSEALLFKNQVMPKLQTAGFVINEGTSYGGCETLVENKAHSKTYLYLHPMEFTGYMKEEDIKKVMKVLLSCSCINKVYEPEIMDVYEISDSEYSSILAKHSKEILEMLKESIAKKRRYDFEFDFIKKYRIPRVGDSSCLSSTDFEYIWLDTFSKVMEAFHLL